ncbi:MAG: type IV secretion system DNA-binding domain-containing protein [Candidatus Jacksonbacteria bacterium]|nr:type IV secretion system DNA-binding domain-containing protein [Candidatus Jacksonbacteria bacterium]
MFSVLILILRIIIIASAAATILAVPLFFIRARTRKKAQSDPNYKDAVFLIKMPKESTKVKEEKEKGGTGNAVETLRQKIALAQTFFANLYGIDKVSVWHRFFYGPSHYISLEIVAKEGLIYFYLVVPRKIAALVEQQIHAQFPDADVNQENDYNIFTEQGEIAACAFRLERNDIIPLKTYRELETDPLNAITNSLSKLDVREGAAIQILTRPKERSWSRRGMRVASHMQQGKSLSQAMSSGLNPLSLLQKGLYGLISIPEYGLTTSSKKDKELGRRDWDKKKDYRLSPLEEEIVKAIENKSSQLGYAVNIRVVASSEIPGRADALLHNIANSFAQFDGGQKGNGFRILRGRGAVISRFIFRAFTRGKSSFTLSGEELAGLWHPPFPGTDTPNIVWQTAKRASPPHNLPEQGAVLGKTNFRGIERTVRIKKEDRRRHLYVIGRSGSGKSVLISNLAIQDIQNGYGVCVLDPHGELVESVLENIPKTRVDDVIHFDPSDMERPVGLNMLEFKTEDQKDFAVQEMIAIFYKLFPPEMIGPMFEHNMRNVMLTLMADTEFPGTIADIPRMFTDKEFQKYKVSKLKDPVVKSFWEKEMAQTTDFHKSEMLGYLISKVGRFVENEMIRNIIGQPKSGFDFRAVMDERKILLINLSKGKTGEVNSSLLGLIIVAKLQMAALARAELPEQERHDFYLYIDEFQNFITDSISTILSEARKYRLDLILAHQYLAQLKDEKGQQRVLDAVLGNVGTLIAFRVGVEDAEVFAKEFSPVFNEYDVVNIDKYRAYVKLLIDNTAAPAFDMATFPPKPGNPELARAVKELSRLKYGRARAEVGAEILERTQLGSFSKHADFGSIEASL